MFEIPFLLAKAAIILYLETCKEEGIACEVEVDYNDNAHCIDLISSLVSGFHTYH